MIPDFFSVAASICFGLFLVAVLACLVVLPIIALVRTRRIGEISARLDRLERELRQVRLSGRAAAPPPEAEAPVEAEAAAEPVEVQPVEPVPQTEAPRRVGVRRRPELPTAGAADVEAWIGRRGLGWVAVILLLFAGGFFLKAVFENRWVGELGRVAIGVLIGSALCGAGLRYHRRGWRLFGQMLTSGGVVLLYLATFGAFGYYHLLPQGPAAVFLIALVAETAALAVLYEAPAVALMAVIGGLLTPLLLHTDRDQYRNLFTYLAVLDAGVVGLALFRAWPAIGTVALLGTQGLFWGWYSEHYHPEKLGAALVFQVVVFGLFVAHAIAAHVLRARKAGIEDLARMILNAFLFFGAVYTLLNEDYHVWMGTLAILMAVAYTALGWLVLRKRPEDQRQLLVVVGTALAFVALAFPLQAEADWVPLGWAVEGLALWWFGLRVRAPALRILGAVLLGLATVLVLGHTPEAHTEPFVPLLNSYALPALAVAACLLGAASASRRYLPRLSTADQVGMRGTGLAGVGLVWLILSVDTWSYFHVQLGLAGSDVYLERMAHAALSAVWAIYAAVVLAVGFRLRSGPLRWAALGLFGLTLLKVVFFDMAELPGFYRVATFLVLSLMMAGAAWGYQKLKPARPASEQEVIEHEVV